MTPSLEVILLLATVVASAKTAGALATRIRQPRGLRRNLAGPPANELITPEVFSASVIMVLATTFPRHAFVPAVVEETISRAPQEGRATRIAGTRFGTHGPEGIHMKSRSTRAIALSLVLFPFALGTAIASMDSSDSKRLAEAASIISEFRADSDKGIPEDLWRKAECVLVFPNMKKAAFIVGGEHGKGVMSCRAGNGWSAPVFMDITKGSAGFQIGVESIDLVLVVMNREGAEKLLNNKVTLGADASVAAGPVGRTATAGTDAQLTAQILSYSRSKGLFAGINLSGGAITPDKDANAVAYGGLTPSEVVLMGKAPVPVQAASFVQALGGGARATSGTTTPAPAPSTGKSKSKQPAPKY